MKKLYSFLTVFCLFGLFFAFTPSQAGAVDVWAYSFSGNEYKQPHEAYVVSDSIQWNRDHTAVSCLVKLVHNGQILKVYRYSLMDSDGSGFWRYTTPGMPIWSHFEPNDGSIGNILQVCYNYL